MKYNEIKFEVFDVNKALQGAPICEISEEEEGKAKFVFYVYDFQKVVSSNSDIVYSGINSETKQTEYYKSDYHNANTNKSNNRLALVTSVIQTTEDTSGGTRADPDTGKNLSYQISSLLPKDQIAMNVLNAMLTHVSIDDLQKMPDATINRLSEISYVFAQSMINTASLYRNELGKTTTTGEGESQETTTTSDDKNQQSLKDIATAVTSLSDEKKGLFLKSSETKPINVKLTGSSSSEGGEMTGDIVMSTAEGKPIETKITESIMVRNPANDVLACVIDSQKQNDKGPIPIKIDGGAIGQEFRNHDNTVKQMPSIVKFANEACALAYDSNSKTLTLTIEDATSTKSGLLSSSVLKNITDLVSLVGLNNFSFGGTTYTTIQGVLTAIDDRLKALENK